MKSRRITTSGLAAVALLLTLLMLLSVREAQGQTSAIGSANLDQYIAIGPGSPVPNLACADCGSSTVISTVNSGKAVDSEEDDVSVGNNSPEIEQILVPTEPVAVNYFIQVSATFTDPGVLDTHTAVWEWGDGTTTDGTVAGQSVGPDDHTYASPGIYVVALTVEDDGGLSDIAESDFVVVYDPEGGFVSGGGWIDSPAGAYKPEPSLSGKATFGFVSKYRKGAQAPTGNTEFQFRAGDMNFHSDTYEWLVVTGPDMAKYKGTGTINGEGAHKFMIWAGDAEPDTFRIKIWTEDGQGNETVIYDNGFEQAIGGGSIVIHKR